MKKGIKFKKIEYMVPLLVLALVLVGFIALIIATANPFTGEEMTFGQIMGNLDFSVVGMQALFFVIGTVIMVVLMFIDYRIYSKIWYLVLAAGIGLLLLVMVLGSAIGGTKGWIYIGSITIQPSEMVKLAMILVCAKFLASNNLEKFTDVLPAVGAFVAIIAVLLYQMDIGTTIVYIVAFVGMAFMAGMKLRHMAIFAGAAAAFALFAWFVLMGPRQQSRILNFFTPGGSGDDFLQLNHSITVISSGGFFGKGLFSVGSMSQLNYVPVIETDFIFVAIAETFGFFGCLIILAIYAVIIFRLFVLAKQINDKFGALIIYGFMFMLLFHVFENVGMTIGIMPITGIPLPFISKGGSNMITNMAGMGLVLSVCYYGRDTERDTL